MRNGYQKNFLGDQFKKACLELDGAIHRGKDAISTQHTKNDFTGRNIRGFAKQYLRY